MALDSSGNLFAGQANSGVISEIKAGSDKITRTFLNGSSETDSLTVDASNNLYVGSVNVNVYASGATSPERTIGSPEQFAAARSMAFDANGDLYVAWWKTGAGEIAAYAPGSTSPYRRLSSGVDEPEGVAVDSNFDIAVANFGNSSVQVYPSGSQTPVTITSGVNHNRHHVTMYPPGSNNLGLQIGKHQGIVAPVSVLFH